MTSESSSKLSLTTLSIRQHIGTLVLALTVIVMGVFYTARLPVDLLPSITYPRIGVRVEAPGISPEVAIDSITRPLEEALATTDGVEQIYSQTREGQVSVDLYFSPGGNIDQALNDATASVNRARGDLPDTVEQPELFKVDPSQQPVYEFALTSPSLEGVDLRIFAEEELARELAVVPGVASVDVSGAAEEEVQVNVDLNRLQALNVGLTDVLDGITDRNQDVSGGRIEGGQEESLTRTIGRFREAEEIQSLSFEVGNNAAGDDLAGNDTAAETPATTAAPARRVYLRDFAEVNDGTEDQRVFVFLNGTPAVKVSIQKQPDANTVTVVEGVKARIESLQSTGTFPEGLEIVATLDESRFIQSSIANVISSGLTGAGLATIAVLLFLGSLRQTLIIILAIPLTTMVALILMGLFGLSINVFSLGGLALSVGSAVDCSIVIMENVAKRVGADFGNESNQSNGNGKPRSKREFLRLAEEGSQELESALTASTLTNVVSVVPFLLVGGFLSLLFNELILTVIFSASAALLVSLTIVPMLTSRLLAVRWSSGVRNLPPLRWFRQRLAAMTVGYRGLLGWVVHRRIIIIALAFLLMGGGSLLMASRIPQEVLPRINTGQARLFAQFPPGTPLEDNRKVMEAIEDTLRQQPEVQYVFTTAGGFLFGTSTSENPLRGSSTITMKSGTDLEAFVDRMNREFNKLNLVGTRIRVSAESVRGLVLNNSPIRGGDIDVGLQGQDTETLKQAGQQVLAALDQQAQLAQYRPDADPDQPEVQIRPDWERADSLGLTAQDIGDTVQTAIEGTVPTQLQRGERLVDIRVQLKDGAIQQSSQLQQLPLFTDNNRLVRLGDVAQVELGQAPGQIQRLNQREIFLGVGNLTEGVSLGDALEELNNIVSGVELPQGVTVLPSFSAQSTQEVQSALVVLGGLASFLVFVVMAVQYNSLIDPLVIMLTIPLALAGGIFGLFITQTAVGITVIIGAVLLVGIVVNNAIIMVELANQIREEENISHQAAILRAAPERLQPILMTTITTVLGAFPLALGGGEGSEFLQPLGVVVFSGLSIATLLTLFIIPCFYTLFHSPPWKPRAPKALDKGTKTRPAQKEGATAAPRLVDEGDAPLLG
ncbi:efflux RND transporter permease subunit [Phormidium tenue FACHB-886]|nr:efflux RND transporter permease subunit [Phormidium tenue FACHB-886]